MRAAWAGILLVVVAACSPEIGSGTYFCGPERLCPPELVCDDNSFTCVNPLLQEAFACPEGSEDSEPDGDLDHARDLGALACDQMTVLGSDLGCITSGADVDLFRLEHDVTCANGDRALEITLRYPIALVPIVLELLDDSGTVVASGELCTPAVDYTGQDYMCIDARPASGIYFVRVSPAAEGPDCDGDCDFNRYTLDIKFVPS